MTNFSWPTVLSSLLAGEDLTRTAAGWAMTEIMSGDATPAQIGAFMLALRSKGETAEELAGLVDVMLQSAVVLDISSDALDIVGTGGDLVGTVNISSMASIVASAAGIPALKHGSRSASGKTGSSEMLEILGIRLDLSPQQVVAVFRKVGITFFFAPVFHPAMRHVAAVRRELAIPTTFNFLGPLAHPAQPIATALGVADSKIAPLMAQELAQRGRTALVFRSDDGLDELSTTATARIWQVTRGNLSEHSLDARAFGLDRVAIDTLLGGDARHNANIANLLFNGAQFENSKAIREVVLLNAAAGIVSYELAKQPELANVDLETRFSAALEKAATALDTGATAAKLSEWSQATQAS